jgi:hypothetical protein
MLAVKRYMVSFIFIVSQGMLTKNKSSWELVKLPDRGRQTTYKVSTSGWATYRNAFYYCWTCVTFDLRKVLFSYEEHRVVYVSQHICKL